MKEGCLSSKCSPRQDPVEFSHCLALVFLILGMILVTVAFAIPRNYVFDPDLPASEMEAIEKYYSERGAALDMCIVAGTVLVGMGGLTIAAIFMVMLIQGDFNICFSTTGEDDKEKCLGEKQPGYGSVVNQDIVDSSAQSTQTH